MTPKYAAGVKLRSIKFNTANVAHACNGVVLLNIRTELGIPESLETKSSAATEICKWSEQYHL